jgi:hypothetical protein
MSRDLAEEKRALRRAMRDAREALGATSGCADRRGGRRLLALPVFDDVDGRSSPATSPSAAS